MARSDADADTDTDAEAASRFGRRCRGLTQTRTQTQMARIDTEPIPHSTFRIQQMPPAYLGAASDVVAKYAVVKIESAGFR